LVVDAEPVGRIYLQDQENHEQIRAGFVADSYAENFGAAISKVGVPKMLGLVKARLFAHNIDDSSLTERIRTKAQAEAKAEFDAKVETLRQDFVSAALTAISAADKNMYQGKEESNALKAGLFNSLVQAGLSEQHAVWAIEAGFEESAAYLNFITQKAIEIMDQPKEARAAFEKIVAESGKLEVAQTQQPEEETLADRLVRSSITASSMGKVVSGEDKKEVRASIQLSANRR